MHSVIHDIVNSTGKRIRQLRIENGPNVKSKSSSEKRDIVNEIRNKKSQNKVAVIAEVKPASPGKKLRDISPQDAAIIASEMERAGAVAISVLTEPEFFHGSIENLNSVRENVSIPVLRKDFIIDESQFAETESDIILLIAGILESKLDSMVNIAISNGFEPLVEVHNEKELEQVLKTKARVIGINNRDLSTLEIDLDTSIRLIPEIKKFDADNNSQHVIISESGMHTVDDIKKVMQAGADAVLVGTSIIRSGEIYAKTRELVDALD